jgi:hypothetical protein
MAAQRFSRERTLAEQAAMLQIETIRSLPYASVGVANGNPSGTVKSAGTVTLKGINGTIQTQITYVSDPTPSGFVTKADYKKVVVTVARALDSKQLAKEITYIAPPGDGSYAPASQAIATAQVVDYALNSPLVGATVSLGTGPSAPRSDVTDGSGTAVFPDLTPNPTTGSQMYYDLTTSVAGYQTLPDDLPPAGNAHVKLVAGQSYSTVLRLFKPATIYVSLFNSSGTAYTGAATVTVGSPRQAQSFAYSGSTLAITSLNGESIVPSLSYTVSALTGSTFAPAVVHTVPSNYPTVLTQNYSLTFNSAASTTKTLTITVKAGSTVVKGARVDVTGGTFAVFLTGTTNTSGVIVFTVPVGNGYKATATGANGEGTGTWGPTNISANTTTTIQVS